VWQLAYSIDKVVGDVAVMVPVARIPVVQARAVTVAFLLDVMEHVIPSVFTWVECALYARGNFFYEKRVFIIRTTGEM
jgi:hypothetical protein